MKWMPRERPKIDRIACPWLMTRFIDKEPEFLYVPASSALLIGTSLLRHPQCRAEPRWQVRQFRGHPQEVDP